MSYFQRQSQSSSQAFFAAAFCAQGQGSEPDGPLTGYASWTESLNDLWFHFLTWNGVMPSYSVCEDKVSGITKPLSTYSLCMVGPAAFWDPPSHIHHTEEGQAEQSQFLTVRHDLERQSAPNGQKEV